ncbi:MAG: DNA primase [Caldilineales bacterium]|nr:DNA primase [Caldilineales bacterium]
MSAIDEIKDRLDIVDVIGGYIPLQKAGRNYKALCPFHAEKTPSFYVFPDRGTWRCFGACSTGGDVIRFVEKKENVDFRTALELLAKRAHVDLDRDRDPEAASKLNRLREIHTLAAGFFQHQLLHTPGGEPAQAYLQRRGILAETVASFQLGYAPQGWDALLNYLAGRDFAAAELETAGLVVRRDGGGHYDRFRGRVMIPIRDAQGRVIGFGGRILDQGEPKYLNSPQTPLFDKGSVIFALDLARRALLAQDQAVIVEGYMDVISAHQAGFNNVVAAMGTAITPPHLQRLSRYTRTFVFALDADAAGASATLRSLQVAREALASAAPVPTARGLRYETRLGAVIKIAAMPPGQDPDDVIRHDPAAWQHLIAAATPLLDFLFEQSAAAADLKTAQGKVQLVRQLAPSISEIDDPVERRHYIGRLARLVGVNEREIDLELENYVRQQGRAKAGPRQQPPAPEPHPPASSGADEEPPLWPDDNLAPAPRPPAPVRPATAASSEPLNRLELHILAHLFAQPTLLAWADHELAQLRFDPINAEDFQETPNRAMFDAQQEFLYSDAAAGPTLPLVERLNHLAPGLQLASATLQQAIAGLETVRDEQRRKDLLDSILQLRRQRLRERCRDLEILLHASDGADLELHRQLTRQTRDLKHLEQALASRRHSSRWLMDQRR